MGLSLSLGLSLGGACLNAGGGAPSTLAPTISRSKDGSIGQTYTATPGGTGTIAYQWFQRGGADISGATSATYVAAAGDLRKFLDCRVTKQGEQPGTARSLGRVLQAPVLIESFESTTGFTASSSATRAVDTTRKAQGAGSIAMQSNTFSHNLTKTIAGTDHDPSTFDVVAGWFDQGDIASRANAIAVDIQLGRDTSTLVTLDGVTRNVDITRDWLGGFWHAFNVSEVSGLMALAGPGTLGIGSRISVGEPFDVNFRSDAFVKQSRGAPTVVLTFDDAIASQFDNARGILNAAGIKATFFIPTALVGDAGKMTLSQLLQLKADGHDLQMDGTQNDSAMTGRANPAANVTELQTMQAYLASNGLNADARHFCYPNGTYRISGTSTYKSALTCNGTTTVTMADTSDVIAGMLLAGRNAPDGVTVAAIVNGTTVTMSGAVPAGVTRGSFTDTSGAYYNGKLQTALKAAGFGIGRTTLGASEMTRYGIDGRALLFPGNSTSARTLADLMAKLTEIETRGTTAMFYTHGVDATGGGINMTTTDFQAWITYLKARIDADALDVITVDQLWRRDGGNSFPL